VAKRNKKRKSYITHPHDLFFKGQLGLKKHAKCFVKEVMPSEILRLIDLDSLELKNGTYVDGKKITQTLISDGDEFKIGWSTFRFSNTSNQEIPCL